MGNGTESGSTPTGQRIAKLAQRQHGVVSTGQLRAAGLSDEMISTRVADGTLHRVFRGAHAVGHRAIGRRGRMLAAVLACGEEAVLSHGSAAELLGLWDRQQAVIHVIPPKWTGRKIDGVRWHGVRYPAEDEVTVVDGISCTTASRTLVDIAGSVGAKTLRHLIEGAAVRRLLKVHEVDEILARGRRRGARQLRVALIPWRSGGGEVPVLRSRLEARLFPALIEAGLPRPLCNHPLVLEGRRIEVDMLWEGQRLAIETDGEETHGTRDAFERDRDRDQRLAVAGYRTARVTWRQVEDDLSAVVERIARMLAVRLTRLGAEKGAREGV